MKWSFKISVAQLAKHDVNKNVSILSNYELHLNALDGQCTADVVMKRFIEIITNWDYKSVVGILGKIMSGQSYKAFTIVNYNSRVVNLRIFLVSTILEL